MDLAFLQQFAFKNVSGRAYKSSAAAAESQPGKTVEDKRELSPKKSKKKKKEKIKDRQAKETLSSRGVSVEVLCKQCRQSNSSLRQQTLNFSALPREQDEDVTASGLEPDNSAKRRRLDSAQQQVETDLQRPSPSPSLSTVSSSPPLSSSLSSSNSWPSSPAPSSSTLPLLCNRCRRPMTERGHGNSAWKPARWATKNPFHERLARYKKLAEGNETSFDLSDSHAIALMRESCCLCGRPGGMDGNGLTRLRIFPPDWSGPRRGMGPFSAENVAPCCSVCNLMKGFHTVRGFTEICRTIATHRKLSSSAGSAGDVSYDDFGRFPARFPDNSSKRHRSSYLTDSKTFSMTNEEFKAITSGPCHFCGKLSVEGKHQNGLDRLDSTVRVYNKASCVSCCGTCNISKYRLSENDFLEQCYKVAVFAMTRVATGQELPGDRAESEGGSQHLTVQDQLDGHDHAEQRSFDGEDDDRPIEALQGEAEQQESATSS